MRRRLLRKPFSDIIFKKEYAYKEVSAPILFEVVCDVNKYHKFVPMCYESRVLRYFGANSFEADLEIDYKMWKDRYTSLVEFGEAEEENSRVFFVSSKSVNNSVLKYLNSFWKIRDLNPGCFIDYKIEFEFQNLLYNSLSNGLKGIIAHTTMRAMIAETKRRQSTRFANIKGNLKPLTNYNQDFIEQIKKVIKTLGRDFKMHDDEEKERFLRHLEEKGVLKELEIFFKTEKTSIGNMDHFRFLLRQLMAEFRHAN